MCDLDRRSTRPMRFPEFPNCPRLDKHVRVAILVKSRRCLDGNDTACSLQESLAALDDATAILKPFSQLRAVCVTDAS